MDTISRENNSMLPVFGIIVGVVGMLLGGFALVQASKANKALTEQQTRLERIDAVEQQAANAQAAAEKGARDLKQLNDQTQSAFNTVSSIIGNLQGTVVKLEEAAKKPAPAAAKKGAAPAVAGPDEYIVKSGDTGAKIARANGIPLSDLMSVNPGVNWNRLGAGDKLKLPAKR